MSFLIQDAWAETAPAATQQADLMSFLPLIVLFIVFYFLLIRPQSKRAKEHKTMVDNLAKGDEVITSGGLLGKITSLSESFVVVELGAGMEVKVQRQAITSVMPKGTLKSL